MEIADEAASSTTAASRRRGRSGPTPRGTATPSSRSGSAWPCRVRRTGPRRRFDGRGDAQDRQARRGLPRRGRGPGTRGRQEGAGGDRHPPRRRHQAARGERAAATSSAQWEVQGRLLCQTGQAAEGCKLFKRIVEKTKDDFNHHAWGGGAYYMEVWGIGRPRRRAGERSRGRLPGSAGSRCGKCPGGPWYVGPLRTPRPH